MNAKRYLFVTLEGGGNVPPVLGAARRLVVRGHDVTVLTEPCLQEVVAQVGAKFRPLHTPFARRDRDEVLFDDWKARTPMAAVGGTLDRVILGPARETARDVMAAVDELAPDAIVADWMLPAAVTVGEARRLPTAVLLHCINMLPAPGRPAGPMPPARGALGRLRDRLMWSMFRRIVAKHAAGMHALRAELGLPPLSDALQQYASAERVLVQASSAFDFVADPEPANVRYVGPVLDEPDWLADATWQSPWPSDDARPLVVLSLSTTFQNQHAILQTAIDALGRLDVRGLVTRGPAMRDVALRVPDNVVVVESAPHGLVFPHASAFITHCGHGSAMRALRHGVPLVALPMGRDQDGVATRIVYRGLGLRPRRNAAAIAAAVRRVLDEPAFADAAADFGRRLAEEVSQDRLTTELEGLTAFGRSAAA